MANLTESEFARICAGLRADRESILKNNPVGTPRETILWMLLSVLISYLSLSENEAPCFTGRPDENTYRDAILYVVERKRAEAFNAEAYIQDLLSE
ncbi:MAG TPA: hypothetical protein VJL58_04695 [Pyrinomonadaceae bacterium]|nr:hypothetical protein [Pyrinomonadaceae bacterium]